MFRVREPHGSVHPSLWQRAAENFRRSDKNAQRVPKIAAGNVLLLLLVAQPLLANPAGRVRLGNVSFDPGSLWTVLDQGGTLLMIPNTAAARS